MSRGLCIKVSTASFAWAKNIGRIDIFRKCGRIPMYPWELLHQGEYSTEFFNQHFRVLKERT